MPMRDRPSQWPPSFATLLALQLVGLTVVSTAFADPPAVEGPSGPTISYNRDVRPILSERCLSCHGPDAENREAGLRLDRFDEATRPLESGARAVVPGSPKTSELLARVMSEDPETRMPPPESGARLTAEEVETLTRWLQEGANYAEHWAFISPKRPPIPSVQKGDWARNDIDRFLLSRMEREGLEPSPEAEPHVLVRRLSLDLRGLPPSPEEVRRFVEDKDPNAYEGLVDRFLADPAYGERWARMWLDLARYADSKGYGSDPLRTIWRYRDWTIDAFNQNLPFDQFTVHQLAGDLLPEPTSDHYLATAFHRNTMTNTEGGTDDEEFRVAAVKDRVDTTLQVWMGLTVGCAKCHSHKYDPISQREYYQLYAYFNQTLDNDQPDESPTMPVPSREYQEQLDAIDAKIASLRETLSKSTPELESKQLDWEKSLAGTPNWMPLHPRAAHSEGGASLAIQSDGSILAGGTNPKSDVYTVSVQVEGNEWTAFRLATIPDPSLPNGGAGRAPDGNFVLSQFQVTAAKEETAGGVRGRYVRIELPGEKRILSLAEVQVYRGPFNLARDRTARQSSTAFGGDAGRATDGNVDGRYFEANSTTHTNEESDPWWEVDLGEDTVVDRVKAWSRTDGGLEFRLEGFRVVVLDQDRAQVWESTPQKAPRPQVEIAISAAQSVPLAGAGADFSQQGFSVANAIQATEPTLSGWAVGPEITKPHFADFVVAKPELLKDWEHLTFHLVQGYKEPGFNLGRFQILGSTDPITAIRASVPAEILAIVDNAPDARSEAERERLAKYFRSIAELLDPVRAEIADLEKSKPEPPVVPVMQEVPLDQRRKTHVMAKGNFLSLGEEVEPGVPIAFHPFPSEAPPNRLGLAYWLVDPANPLTARVAVNRFWARLFQIGLVASEEDFGTQGDDPVHPELLDWLAFEFQANGWDVKDLLRTIVTSSTYRQSSRVSSELLEKDPQNRWLARAPRYRLEAEMIRDQALALAGLLSHKRHGPSVFPPQPPDLWRAAFNGSDRTWATSTGEDRYRRGIYTFWRRTIPYPSMTTFDAPSREICSLRRSQTNTPLQALVTLNDPVYVEAAQALARRIVRDGGDSAEDRIRYGLSLCLVRPSRDSQVAPLLELYRERLAYYQNHEQDAVKMATDPLGALPAGTAAEELAAWTVVASVLLNLDGVLTRG